MIEIIRGDTLPLCFTRKDKDGETITTLPDKVYFSVKKNYKTEDTIIQKTLDDITIDADSVYHFVIEPSDTDALKYDDYVYDIEVITGTYKQTIVRGIFRITEEVTFADNEV